MQRDQRRLFTSTQKQEVLAASNYRCQGKNCSNPDLSNQPFEFHHIKAHSEFGATERTNCIPLCVPCHRKYTREQMQHDIGDTWKRLRQWQLDAVERYMLSNDKNFVLEAAMGAGKSLFAATVASYELNRGTEDIDHVFCVAPWLPILKSIRDSFGVYRIETRDQFHYSKEKGVLQARPQRPVTLDTYWAFCCQMTVDLLSRWTNDQKRPFKFMLILDEIHHATTVSGKWGPYLDPIAKMASKIVVMSGTYFRTDCKPISFLEYENNRPKTDYSIDYSTCVRFRYTRQVSFRYHDSTHEIYHRKKGKEVHKKLSKIPKSSPKMLSFCKKEVLDVNGIHVERMIREAWVELQAMRKKWSDAACLVVCQSGRNYAEEKIIYSVAEKINKLTGARVETVASDDPTSRGKVEHFVNSDDPFLCAIRMVSEGANIPRVRMILFLSYTDSELLFRQIVGRATRYIDGKEDDTAALVIMPKFAVMAEFAERFESEAKIGALQMESKHSPGPSEQQEPQACKGCKSDPCKCYVVLSSTAEADGGQIASSVVDEEFVQIAKVIRDTSAAHQHSNPVQLADALQRGSQIRNSPMQTTVDQERAMAWNNITRTVRNLAKHIYRGDMRSAWLNEIHDRTGSDAAEIQSTWRTDDINKLHEQLKKRLLEALADA